MQRVRERVERKFLDDKSTTTERKGMLPSFDQHTDRVHAVTAPSLLLKFTLRCSGTKVKGMPKLSPVFNSNAVVAGILLYMIVVMWAIVKDCILNGMSCFKQSMLV